MIHQWCDLINKLNLITNPCNFGAVVEDVRELGTFFWDTQPTCKEQHNADAKLIRDFCGCHCESISLQPEMSMFLPALRWATLSGQNSHGSTSAGCTVNKDGNPLIDKHNSRRRMRGFNGHG